MEYITQKFILNKGNKINIRLDNPLELPGNEWYCGLKEFSLEPKWSLAEDEVIVNFQDGTNITVKPINTYAAANIDTVLEELFPKRRGKRSPKGKDLLGDITGTNRKKAKLAEETKTEEEYSKEEPKKEESKKEEPKQVEAKKEESKKEEAKTEESKTEEKKEDSNTKEPTREEFKKEEATKVGTDFVVDDNKLVLNYEKGHYPEKGEAQKLVDEKQKKPDLVSSITGTQAKQEQKQQELEAQKPRAEGQFFDGVVMQKYKEEQKLKEGQKIEIPSKNPVPTVVDVTVLQDLNDKYIALKKAKEEQKQVEEKSEVQKPEEQKPEEQKIEIPSKYPVPAVVDVTALQGLSDKYNALKKAKEEKAVGETQKTVDQEKQSDITMSEKTQTTDFEIKEDQKNTITVSDETESKVSKEIVNENYENNLAGLKSIAFTKINNRYTVTFDTNHVRSLKLSHGFAQAIGYTQTTTLLNNQFASDPPAVNPFYSHICIRMHGVLRPLNKNHDAEIAVIPIEKGKTIYSISPQPLYFKVEKTFIDTISLEFRDFLDNPIVCDRANGHFVLQFVKRS